MAYVTRVAQFKSPLNRGFAAIVTAFNAQFVGGSNQFISADYHRLQSPYGGDSVTLQVLYADATAGLDLLASLFSTDAASTAEAKFNAFFAANCYVPLEVIDVTQHELNKTNPDELLVISARTDNAGQLGLLGHDGSVFIAEPLANIAAGAAGNCIIFDSNGHQLSGSFAVTNGSIDTWTAGDRSYAFYDATTGLLVSLAPCGGVPAALVPAACPPAPAPGSPCATRERASSEPTETVPWIVTPP